MRTTPLLASLALLITFCGPLRAADTVTLNYTAKMRWGEQSGPATSAVLDSVQVNNPTGWFDVTGTIVIGLTAPPVIGFSAAHGYWSEESLQGFTMNFGSQTFSWINLAGSLNNRWGLSLADTSGSGGDLVSTANAAQPFFGGMMPSMTAAGAGNGLLSLTQPAPGPGRDLALGTMGFWWAGPHLLSSNQLLEQDFAHLGQFQFGDANASGGADIASGLNIQMWALPSGSTVVESINNAQNASGYFSTVTPAVPEPSSALLLVSGALLLGLRLRRRQAV